jgi:hypothetical protein
MSQPKSQLPSAADHSAAAGNDAVAIAGSYNVVVTSHVGGNVTVTIGGQDVRADELRYLDALVAQYRYWAETYTPLAGIAEVHAAADCCEMFLGV